MRNSEYHIKDAADHKSRIDSLSEYYQDKYVLEYEYDCRSPSIL
jgi:hypothetical protein